METVVIDVGSKIIRERIEECIFLNLKVTIIVFQLLQLYIISKGKIKTKK